MCVVSLLVLLLFRCNSRAECLFVHVKAADGPAAIASQATDLLATARDTVLRRVLRRQEQNSPLVMYSVAASFLLSDMATPETVAAAWRSLC